ncbi:helix-turn-helix domain-containing protein [Paraliobacillus ryukyuensis]|uniref:helix-turn-helix domain-containing protein n=1 Tax=Paraliobacillus ryukyuensis TaxID=200904 RepID=UPI0009A88E58
MRLKLLEYLKDHQISIRFLSKKAELRYATVYSYAHNQTGKLNLDNLTKIMKALNIKDVSLIIEYQNPDDQR